MFSSPFTFSQNDEQMIAEMNMPDIWDTLLVLEQTLSPIEERAQSFEECSQDDPPRILNRLSQQFKKTPTRFTEKLVSLIEDSVISSESPIKQYSHENSGISLNRMTGEFRKLCKFIEDESMPEWAPSLMNMTGSCSENNVIQCEKKIRNCSATPKNLSRCTNNTSTPACTPQMLKSLLTPRNKILFNVNSPINRFTPSADKSFEYWESVCNMMCENKSIKIKNETNSPCRSETSKHSMNEMLTICERQLASLDDSAIDIRNSEPCKKTDSDLKVKIQTPRSKSESKIILKTNEKNKKSDKKSKVEKINNQIIFNNDELSNDQQSIKVNENLIFDNKSKSLSDKDLEQNTRIFHDDSELLKDKDIRASDQEIFETDFISLYSSENKQISMESSYNDNKQDCSLLIELAKRRQRCLDTAKLMLEIDREDPINNEDSKCLETLYKLGIQDKTLNEVEEDSTFLNTLSQCIDYKNYISIKSKPLLNMLHELNSPDDFKSKATSAIRSKKLLNNIADCKSKSQQRFAMTKPSLDAKKVVKNPHDKKNINKLLVNSASKSSLKATLKPSSKPTSKSTSALKVEKKTCNFQQKKALHLPDLQEKKVLPETDKKIPCVQNLQKVKVAAREVPRTPVRTAAQAGKKSVIKPTPEKVSQKAGIKSSTKLPRSDLEKSRIQSKKLTPNVASTVLFKNTPQSNKPKVISQVTPKVIAPETNEIHHNTNKFSSVYGNHANEVSRMPKMKLFVTPGKSPSTATLGRRKPPSYFLDSVAKKTTPVKADYNNVKSLISLYINGTDTDLIQNVHGRINDRLLTPVSNGKGDKDPKLKFTLSSKENKVSISNTYK
jgi:hypothetical protein